MPTYEKPKIFRKLDLDSYRKNGEGVSTSFMEFSPQKIVIQSDELRNFRYGTIF